MGYGDLLTELSRYAGAGQARRIAEDEAVEAQIKGFGRLAPVRQAARAEEVEAEYGPEAGAQVRAGAFPGKKPTEAAAKRAEERRKTGGILDVAGPTLRKRGVLPPEGPLPESFYEAPPEALHWLLSETKPPVREPRARTMTEWRAIAQTPDDPEREHAQRILNAAMTEKVDVYKQQIKAMGEQPPDVAATERQTLAGAENIEQMGKGIREQFEAGGHAYVNPWVGGEGAASFRRMFPHIKPGLKEEQMRESVNRMANYIIRLEAGLTQSQKEEIRQFRVVPTMGTTPERFTAALEGSILYAQRIEQILRGELSKSRRAQPRPVAPRPDWNLVEE